MVNTRDKMRDACDARIKNPNDFNIYRVTCYATEIRMSSVTRRRNEINKVIYALKSNHIL